MNNYQPDELTRLELLTYPNPEGLHPVEINWRNLCRKLFEDVRELESALVKHKHWDREGDKCFTCNLPKLPRNWPAQFTMKPI